MSDEVKVDHLEAIKGHFQGQVSAGMKKVAVPEWGFDVYFGPETVEQRDSYYSQIADNKIEGFVNCLIARAKDKDGKRIFSPAVRATLMREADPDVIVRVVNDMFLQFQAPEVDDLGK